MKLTAESTVINDQKINTDIGTAQTTANDAKSIADNTNQYFWFTSSGTDTGAHITETTQAQFLANPSGGNLLARSNGIAVRDGMTELATFGASSRIGKQSDSHIEIDYHSMQLVDKDGNSYFYVSDLRGTDGTAQIEQSFIGDGSTTDFELIPNAMDTSYTVAVSDSSGGTVIKYVHSFSFSSAPTSGATITATYSTQSEMAKAYSAGVRRSNAKLGAVSFAEGYFTEASGPTSHAEGNETTASGISSHAEGSYTEANGTNSHAGGLGTIANGPAQTAIGKYNVADTTSLFIVGKGLSEGSRINAFSVASNGTVYVNGTSVHSSDRRLKEHIAYLDDEAVEFIDGLKPVHYIKDGEKHVGFYAQDVKAVDKWDCMIGEEMNGYMTLSYMDLIAPIVTYCQKLEERINKLESEKTNE